MSAAQSKPKRKPRLLSMVVTVPRLEGQTSAQQRVEVRHAIRGHVDYWDRRVSVRAHKARGGAS